MSTHRHIDAICITVLICTLALTILFMNGRALGLQTPAEVEAGENAESPWFTANDRDGSWRSEGATRILLNGSEAAVRGGGAFVYGKTVFITGPGRYVVSGTLEDGRLVVDANSESKVWVRLSGADIRCSDDACIRVEQAEKVFLTLAEGTVNRLETRGFGDEVLAAGVDGTLFSRDDLALNGTGSLEVLAACENGIVSNDDLIIAGGSITVTADGDALHANDTLRITDADLTLSAGDDGIALTGVESGLILASGTVTVQSGDKGLAAGDSVLMLGGTVNLNAGADGIGAAGTVRIEDGTLQICSGDDGIHADTAVEIAGGTLRISDCWEGIEARLIDVSGGETFISSRDDGLNANGSAGFGTSTGTDEETRIAVRGGSVTVVNSTGRDADGFDSNGDILISGGRVCVSMLNSGSTKALDYGSENGGVLNISGGEVIACGSDSLDEGFGEGSGQGLIHYISRRGVPGGTIIRLEDKTGTLLLEYEVPCSFSSAVLSCPDLQKNETYRLVIGDRSEEIKVQS